MALYLASSCYLYRMRTLSRDWDDLYHSDAVLFLLPACVALVACVLSLRRLGVDLTTSVLAGIGAVAVTFGVFLYIAFNVWGT